MTNEELVMRIASGEKEYVAELWTQVEKFIRWRANRFYLAYEDRCKAMLIDVNDLTQESYFAMVKAVKKFDASRGTKFTTILDFYLRQSFFSLTKMNYEGWQHNTIYACKHLDAPANAYDDRPLAATISDTDDELEAVEHEVYMLIVLPALDAALSSLTACQRKVIDSLFYDGLTHEATANRFGMSKGSVNTIKRASLRKLRSNQALCAAYAC